MIKIIPFVLLIGTLHAQDFQKLVDDYKDVLKIETPETINTKGFHFDEQMFEQPRGQHLKVTTFMSYMQKYYDAKLKNEIRLSKIENNQNKIYALLKSNLDNNKKIKLFSSDLENYAAGGGIISIILGVIIFIFKKALSGIILDWGEDHSKKRKRRK